MKTLAQYQWRIFRWASSWRFGGNIVARTCNAEKTGRIETYGRYAEEMAPNSWGWRSRPMALRSASTALFQSASNSPDS